MTHPTCDRCGKPIQVGQMVEMITATGEDPAEARILLSEDVLMVHADAADCEAER